MKNKFENWSAHPSTMDRIDMIEMTIHKYDWPTNQKEKSYQYIHRYVPTYLQARKPAGARC